MKPIAGGGSNYSSQDSTDAIFGLGGQSKGPLDVLWSDGVHNRLYKAEKGQTIVFPEIPCDFKADWADDDYEDCVENALDKLRDAGLLTKKEAKRIEKSANRAYDEEHDD